MPFYAVEEKSRSQGTGVGAPASHTAGNNVTNLQTYTMIDHKDRNTATATEFGWFLDGSPVPSKDWATGEPSAEHFVYEDKNGKWKTTGQNTKFSCITCEMGSGE
jgi:hypothetical protein